MYPDPKKVKDNRIMLRLNDYEHEKLMKLSILTGEQLATVARERMMHAVRTELTSMQIMQKLAA